MAQPRIARVGTSWSSVLSACLPKSHNVPSFFNCLIYLLTDKAVTLGPVYTFNGFRRGFRGLLGDLVPVFKVTLDDVVYFKHNALSDSNQHSIDLRHWPTCGLSHLAFMAIAFIFL